MKVLPKFHGNLSKVEIPLRKILAWAINPIKWQEILNTFQQENGRLKDKYRQLQEGPRAFLKEFIELNQITYPHTADKIARMIYQLYTTGYTSFL